ASRVAAVLGQGYVGYSVPRGLEIQEERDDRMGVWGDRELDLAALGEGAVTARDFADQFPDEYEELAAMVAGKSAAALGQLAHQRIATAHGLTEPGQVIPDRQIVNELI